MKRQESLERRDERIERRGKDNSTAVAVIGGLALIGVVALVIVALPDIRRYIKISRM